MAERQYDVVVLGASGFTGQFVLEELLRERTGERVCAAGRSRERVTAAVTEAGKVLGVDVAGVAVEVVDVSDAAAMTALAAKTRLVINCVGPFREHGLAVARAVVAGGASLTDISGEPQYLEAVQAELGGVEAGTGAAAEAGAHVVSSCGFDSVPADLGLLFLQDHFPGTLHHCEMVAGHHCPGDAVIHATTLQCAVLGYAARDQLKSNRRKIMPERLDMPKERPPKRGALWHSSAADNWCVANIGADRSVVVRTQHLLSKLVSKSPVHFAAYFGFHSFFEALKSVVFGIIFLLMNTSNFGRNLLIKHPRVFSLGMFSWEGPRRENLVKNSFCMTLTGTGVDTDGKKVVKSAKVTGPDPGYIGTAIMIVQCALTMLHEKDKLPGAGGVLTPGAAFWKTSLLERLAKRGLTFAMLE